MVDIVVDFDRLTKRYDRIYILLTSSVVQFRKCTSFDNWGTASTRLINDKMTKQFYCRLYDIYHRVVNYVSYFHQFHEIHNIKTAIQLRGAIKGETFKISRARISLQVFPGETFLQAIYSQDAEGIGRIP